MNISTLLTNTPLIFACRYDMFDVALKILNFTQETPKLYQINNGNTALMYACCCGMSDIALTILNLMQETPEFSYVKFVADYYIKPIKAQVIS